MTENNNAGYRNYLLYRQHKLRVLYLLPLDALLAGEVFSDPTLPEPADDFVHHLLHAEQLDESMRPLVPPVDEEEEDQEERNRRLALHLLDGACLGMVAHVATPIRRKGEPDWNDCHKAWLYGNDCEDVLARAVEWARQHV